MDWCDINELINSAINKNLPSDRHKIIFYQNENLPLFRLDAGLMEQAIHNIIHNAIQHTPENTIIEIRVSHLESTCKIRISDNGKGFPEDEIPWFSKNFTVHPTQKEEG